MHSHCTSTCADEYLIQFLVLPFALHRKARNVSFPFFPALLWLDHWCIVGGQVTLSSFENRRVSSFSFPTLLVASKAHQRAFKMFLHGPMNCDGCGQEAYRLSARLVA